ncbi:MAG: TetR/AcrR family transcriptional regulator [Candidatus Thermochlorobacter sp.]
MKVSQPKQKKQRSCTHLAPRERILKVSLELYLKEGIESLSMRRIARKLGVVPSSLYKHYENKDALVWAIIMEGYSVFASYLQRALTEPTPEAKLHRIISEYLSFAIEQPKYYEVIFLNPHQYFQSSTIPESVRAHSRTTFQILENVVQICLDAGLFKPGDATGIAYTIWTHAHGAVALRLTGLAPQNNDEFSTFYFYSFQNLLRGLRR